MKIIETADRTPTLLRQLLEVWERSVRATHLFLSDGEIRQIKEYVPQALGGIEHLIIAEDGAGRPAAFMGIENRTLEMLFLSPEERGRGLGKRLPQSGTEKYGNERHTVHETEPQTRGTADTTGLQLYQTQNHDDQGPPQPNR